MQETQREERRAVHLSGIEIRCLKDSRLFPSDGHSWGKGGWTGILRNTRSPYPQGFLSVFEKLGRYFLLELKPPTCWSQGVEW